MRGPPERRSPAAGRRDRTSIILTGDKQHPEHNRGASERQGLLPIGLIAGRIAQRLASLREVRHAP